MLLFLKTKLLAFSPVFVRSKWDRIEASPVGYRLARGAFWSLFGALISRGLGLISTILVGRILNAHGFGEFGIIQSTVGLFGTVAGFGLGMSSTKFVAEFRRSDPERAGRVIALSSATAWLSGGIMAGILFFSAPWLAKNTLAAPQLTNLLRISSLLLLLNGVNAAQTGSLSGFESFKMISKVNFISGLVSFPVMITGAWLRGVDGAIFALVATTAVNCLLNWIALRAEAQANAIHFSYKGCSLELPLFLRFNLPAILNSVMLSFSAWASGAILVNQINGYDGMGIYNAVKRIQQLPELLIGMAMAPVLPILSEAFGRKDMQTYGKILLTAFSVSAILMIPFSLVQLAAPWLTLLPYGETYRGGEPLVRWAMAGSLFYGLLWPLGTIMVSLGRMWTAFWLIALNTATFLFLGWLLIPQFGAVGYAAAASTSLIVSNIPSLFLLHRVLGDVMRQFRWLGMLGLTIVLGLVCLTLSYSAGRWLGVATGIAAAAFFIVWRVASSRGRMLAPLRMAQSD